MLAQSVMVVVFVLEEKVTLGKFLLNGSEVTSNGYGRYKSAKETSTSGNWVGGTW